MFNVPASASPRARPRRTAPHHPDFDKMQARGWKAAEAEGKLSERRLARSEQWAHRHGPARPPNAIADRTIPTFARGELPHFAGINTFLKAPYAENVRDVGKYDAAIIGIPFDSGTTYRPGTRFGPQGIRRISALYTPYNYELGVDLREQMTLCDAGDVFTIPGQSGKELRPDQPRRRPRLFVGRAAGDARRRSFDRLSLRARHRAMHRKRIGIIHFDRHVDIQEKDLDERMHTTPWFHATNMPNVSADQSGADRHRRLAGAARAGVQMRASATPTC